MLTTRLTTLFFLFLMQFMAILNCSAQCTIKPIVQHASCSGGSDGSIQLQLTGNPPYRFEWSNGFTTQDINNLTPGTYNVKVFDAKGGTATSAIEIKAKSEILLTVTKTTNIVSVQVSGGKKPYKYFLNSMNNPEQVSTKEQSNNVFTNLKPGKYAIAVVDINGCAAVKAITISNK